MEPSFAAVWSRVTGAAPPEEENEALRRWHREAAEAQQFYTTASQRAGNPTVREALKGIGRDEERQAGQLSALYYLRTGEQLSLPRPESIPLRPLLPVLRERYGQALERSEAYARAAQQAPEDAAELLRSLSEEERDHARTLRKLVERLV